MRSEGETFIAQPPGVDLKEHFDKIEELKEEIHKRDLQVIEERFSKGKKGAAGCIYQDDGKRCREKSLAKKLGNHQRDIQYHKKQ